MGQNASNSGETAFCGDGQVMRRRSGEWTKRTIVAGKKRGNIVGKLFETYSKLFILKFVRHPK